MKPITMLSIALLLTGVCTAEPVPLKKVVDLALTHGARIAAANADEQRALFAYKEARDQYIPQVSVGSGLGRSWGYPLSLEGSAPSIVNFNAYSSAYNPALRDFIRAARTDHQAAVVQSKDQRNQVLQDAVLSYAELAMWEAMSSHLQQEKEDAAKMLDIVEKRIQEGVDTPVARSKARLSAARVRLRAAEAQGAIDVLRNRLSQLTGLPASSIETVADSMPAMPEIKQEDNLAAKAVQSSPLAQAADIRSAAKAFQARGEHRALWPSADFAAQYALLDTTFNNYQQFFQPGSFQRHNATIGVVLRFPFLNFSQKAKADAADAEAVHARKDAEMAKNQVSEQTLQLQRSVEQLAAAQEVADLEYQLAQANFEAQRIRLDAGTATMHDLQDARDQSSERYNQLQDSNFELEKARITLMRATGELEAWLGTTP